MAVGTMAMATAACVAPPLTHPVQLADAQDAKTEINDLLGTPPPVEKDAAKLVETIAAKLVVPVPNCQLLPASEIVWKAPGPQSAAIELRTPCSTSVAGTWYEITLAGDDQVGFTVDAATKQLICKKGVTGTACVA